MARVKLTACPRTQMILRLSPRSYSIHSSFVSHAAFGQSVEQAVTFLTCIQNVRDVILFPLATEPPEF
ncbi:MAG: hypothetical protein U0573_00655 [Phycisphaerales bacterium]|nr:hypothetical protein [Planctomycetota bacterium]